MEETDQDTSVGGGEAAVTEDMVLGGFMGGIPCCGSQCQVMLNMWKIWPLVSDKYRERERETITARPVIALGAGHASQSCPTVRNCGLWPVIPEPS